MERQPDAGNKPLFNDHHVIFSNNHKVSPRQIRRAMTLELFGISSLLLPGYLAENSGLSGVAALLLGAAGALGLLCLWNWMCSQEKIVLDMEEGQITWVERVIKIMAGAGLGMISAYILYLLTILIRNQLLHERYEAVILLTLAGAGVFGLWKGLEARIRIYEVLFWFLLVPLFVILIVACVSVTPAYWCMTEGSPLGFVKSCYISFLFFSLSSLFLFFRSHCSHPERAVKNVRAAIGLVAAWNVVIYLILLGIFQQKLLAQMEFPVILLMAVVKLPGEFFERQDALMVGIWFFCLFALFHSLLFYGKELVRGGVTGAGKSQRSEILWSIGCGGAVLGGTLALLKINGLGEVLIGGIFCIIGPILFLLPLLYAAVQKRHRMESGKGNKND